MFTSDAIVFYIMAAAVMWIFLFAFVEPQVNGWMKMHFRAWSITLAALWLPVLVLAFIGLWVALIGGTIMTMIASFKKTSPNWGLLVAEATA